MRPLPSVARRVRVALLSLCCVTTAGLVACSSDDAPSGNGPADGTTDIYSFAGGCYSLSTPSGENAVELAGDRWSTAASVDEATPFRMQATALGSYLLYGPEGQMVADTDDDAAGVTVDPGPAADWTLTAVEDDVTLTNVETERSLAVDGDQLAHGTDGDDTRWRFAETEGCDEFPDIDPGATGEPFVGESPDAPVRGFLDAHTHVSGFRFLGGNFHCGRPWSPYGVTVALKDCADHADGEVGSTTEAVLSYGSFDGGHDNAGWPSFGGWPKPESLTHESTYWRWIERSWRGGLRLMVNHTVENRALCEIYPGGTDECNDMDSIRQQAQDMVDLQDYIDAQFGGPGQGFFRVVTSPDEARQVINDGKLAVVLGAEVSEIFDCGLDNGEPLCDEAQIDVGLDELQDLGIRAVFPVHKFDNALGGTKYDGGTTGLLVNAGNKYVTGEWWDPQPCADDAVPDNTVISPAGSLEAVGGPIIAVLGETIAPVIEGDLPTYEPGPHCNPKGLTDEGRYVVNGLIDRNMIVETDHMSAVARAEALEIIAEREYSGLVTSHSWGDPVSQQQLQDLGGVVSPYASSPPGFVESWQAAKDGASTEFLFGIGYGSDNNGLGAQPGAREGNEADPVEYPYTTFDGGTEMQQQVSGTRTFDVNADGVTNYGLFPDWIEDLRIVGGEEIVEDLAQGAEAYLQMWERAEQGS